MPEAVATYLKTENLEQVRVVQKEILDAYILDFAKHAPKDEVMKIMAIWDSVPSQLAKENKKFNCEWCCIKWRRYVKIWRSNFAASTCSSNRTASSTNSSSIKS